MPSVFARGRKLYAKIRDVNGKWIQVATGFDVGDEAAARRWATARDREASDERARRGDGPLTVRAYAERWLARRITKTKRDDENRLRKHVYPLLGDLMLVDVRPRHARDLVMALRAAGKLAPKTIREVSGLLHTLFKSAFIEELVPANPIEFERGVLPKKADKDPTWRHEAIYTRTELEQLLFDPRIPFDRRALYALKGLAALRHTEAALLRWSQYDIATRPLGAISLGLTKSGIPRRIPVHPVLATILESWRRDGWPAKYQRSAADDDLIVPTKIGTSRAPAEAQVQLIADLERIGLRVEAGAERNRRGHDLRRTFITLARGDGAIDSLLRLITHGPKPSDMLDVYSSPPWESLCAEVAKLRVRGAVLVQSPQTSTVASEIERPQRDSNPFPDDLGDTGSHSIQVVDGSEVSPSATELQANAPNRGAASN
jgi:integrase